MYSFNPSTPSPAYGLCCTYFSGFMYLVARYASLSPMPRSTANAFSIPLGDIVNSSSLFEMAGFLEGEPRIARKY
jgi:hypothetical protein